MPKNLEEDMKAASRRVKGEMHWYVEKIYS
jgi:hypothetical protein